MGLKNPKNKKHTLCEQQSTAAHNTLYLRRVMKAQQSPKKRAVYPNRIGSYNK